MKINQIFIMFPIMTLNTITNAAAAVADIFLKYHQKKKAFGQEQAQTLIIHKHDVHLSAAHQVFIPSVKPSHHRHN